MEKNYFLIGGLDLEMRAIIDILNENKILFSNKELQWGAKVSAYTDVLLAANNFDNVYGIELINDLPNNRFPTNYKIIDHHNEYNARPSSIEQVAKIIGVTLSRYQQLIAANDKGYIPAMLAMGASPDEIKKIRQADRRAQGVTQKEEDLAKKSIATNRNEKYGVVIIKSLTNKFSAICDRLYPTEKLIVHTDTEINYYGTNAKALAEYMSPKNGFEKAYWGGGNDGFWGLPDVENIQAVKTEILTFLKTLL